MAGTADKLPEAMRFVQRDWLSSNLFFFVDGQGDARHATVVDTGYFRHVEQTVALVGHLLTAHGLGFADLRRVISTHLHSDHCGGNAALARASGAQVFVPATQEAIVRAWDQQRLSFNDFGQYCERFPVHGGLAPGDTLVLGGLPWQALAAPGHDPDSLILHCASHRLLISADALWENGFGILFPELEGASGFAEQAAVLDLIESLPVDRVFPGHGAAFTDVAGAIARARSRLQAFRADPRRHARNSVKALMKFMILAQQRIARDAFVQQTAAVPVIQRSAAIIGLAADEAVARSVDELIAQGQMALAEDGALINAEP